MSNDPGGNFLFRGVLKLLLISNLDKGFLLVPPSSSKHRSQTSPAAHIPNLRNDKFQIFISAIIWKIYSGFGFEFSRSNWHQWRKLEFGQRQLTHSFCWCEISTKFCNHFSCQENLRAATSLPIVGFDNCSVTTQPLIVSGVLSRRVVKSRAGKPILEPSGLTNRH